jgi:hypothetical protein
MCIMFRCRGCSRTRCRGDGIVKLLHSCSDSLLQSTGSAGGRREPEYVNREDCRSVCTCCCWACEEHACELCPVAAGLGGAQSCDH